MTLISPIALVLSSLLLLPTQYSASSLLLVAGGHSNNSLAVEVWPPLLAPDCTLPALPEERWGASLDVQATRPVLCGLSSCWQLSAGGWLNVGDTLQSRWYHSSAKTSEGLLLVGGSGSPNTTELLPIEGGQNTQGMNLDPGRRMHCSIQVSNSSMVLTGGRLVNTATNLVTSYNLETGEGAELSGLITSRYHHACGSYHLPDLQMVLVTGGWDGYGPVNSTEVLDLSSAANGWREVGMLPSARYGLRAASLGDVLYVTGGDDGSAQDMDEVLAWDGIAETWAVAGHLAAPRRLHAVTSVSEEFLQSSFCASDTKME